MKELQGLQNILYKDPIDQEKLTNIVEDCRATYSKEEIDHEFIIAFSLNYERIPVLIPFLSKKINR